MTPELDKLAELAVRTPVEFKEESLPAAKNLLIHLPDDCPAAAIYAAVRRLHGINILIWEPETIWHTLLKDGIDLSTESRNKLQAAMALQMNPAFYWDNVVFQNTVQALNDVMYNPALLQECNPAYMSWAVYEAGILRGMDPDRGTIPEFDEDVQVYVAICLKTSGMVHPSDNLLFCRDALEIHSSPEARTLATRVEKAWSHLKKEDLPEREFTEDPLDVQLAKLAGCYTYVTDRAKTLAEMLLQLKGA